MAARWSRCELKRRDPNRLDALQSTGRFGSVAQRSNAGAIRFVAGQEIKTTVDDAGR